MSSINKLKNSLEGIGSVNMQLIRAINKSNKSNNNNQTSTACFNKVVIIAPPSARSSSVSQKKNGSSGQQAAPVSPSVALPALKKRTSIVKQSVPPPVPPRGSPRSKSKLISVSRRTRNQMNPKPTIDSERLKSLSNLEQSGCQKVKKWLETVQVPAALDECAEISIPEQFEFKSVKKMMETFVQRDDNKLKPFTRSCKISDASLVKARIESYNSLEHDVKAFKKLNLRASDGGTDSGIDIPARFLSRQFDNHRKCFFPMNQFSRDEEFV